MAKTPKRTGGTVTLERKGMPAGLKREVDKLPVKKGKKS